jgi:hypothetical protein
MKFTIKMQYKSTRASPVTTRDDHKPIVTMRCYRRVNRVAVLMTKFGKAVKTGYSNFWFRIVQFGNFKIK